MDPVTFPIDLVWSGPQRPQHGLRQGQSHFPLTREHALCPGLVESGKIADTGGTGEDPDARVQVTGQPDDLCAGLHTGSAQDEAPGPLDSGPLQRLMVARIAVYRRHTGLAQAVDSVPIQLDDRRRHPIAPEQARDRLSDRAVADHDD